MDHEHNPRARKFVHTSGTFRAQKHLQALEVRWWGRQRNVEDPKINHEMEIHEPFLDSPELRL